MIELLICFELRLLLWMEAVSSLEATMNQEKLVHNCKVITSRKLLKNLAQSVDP